MKKNNLRRLILPLLTLMFFMPLCLSANQLPAGKNSRIYEKWEWQDATLQSVVAHISTVSGIDIIVDSKSATEKLSVSLRDKNWQDVVRIICQIKGLTYRVNGNYILIADGNELNNRQMQEAQSARSLEQFEELEKFTIKLKNTTAKEMETPVRSAITASASRGNVVAIEHTNSLLIYTLPKNIESIRTFIEEMDKEVLQISISAKIVEVSSGYQNGLGIQWSFFDGKGAEATHLLSATKGSDIVESALEKATYGILDQSGFSIALEYLFTEKNSEVIAEPQIITLENKEAKIYMKSSVPVLSGFDINGNQLLETKDVGTTLTVTPTVTGQGHIKMALEPIKESYELGTVGGAITHSQGAKTNVVVKDGETIVIAGLTSDDIQETESGIPFLKDIPILGFLFKKQTKRVDKRDLVIFVTPHIIKSTMLDLIEAEADKNSLRTEIQPEPQIVDISDTTTFWQTAR